MHLVTAVAFVFWKSPFPQGLIDGVNQLGLPLHRTIDFTDNLALVSVCISYYLAGRDFHYQVNRVVSYLVACIAFVIFTATSMLPHETKHFLDINKEYSFKFSKRSLVSRLNMVQLKEVRILDRYLGPIDFNSDANVFYINGQKDTLALLLDYNKLKDQDTIVFKTSFARIIISGDTSSSKLKLVSVYHPFVRPGKRKDYREKAIRLFERRVVKKMGRYR